MFSNEATSEITPKTKLPVAVNLTLLTTMIAPTLVFVTLPPALPLIADRFGGANSVAVAQAAQALSFLGGAIGGLLAGTLIARLGLNGMLRTAALAYAAAGAAGMLAGTDVQLFAGCFVVGLASAFLSSGLAMATSVEVKGNSRAHMAGYQAAASDLAAVSMGLAGGFMAQLAGWRAPFAIYIAYGLILTVLIACSKRFVADKAEAGGIGSVCRLAWPVYVGAIVLTCLNGTLQIQLPFHLAEHGLVTSGNRAIVQTFATLGAASVSLSFGKLQAWIGERAMLALGGAIAGMGFIGFALWQGGLWPACAAAIGTGVLMGVGIPMVFLFALRRTPPSLHGYSIGILNTAVFLGGALNPLVFGGIAASFGRAGVFVICGCATIVAGIGISLLVQRRR